jgi:hypothetical protein
MRIHDVKTVAGERGAADAKRAIRRFALKFYTEDGKLGHRRKTILRSFRRGVVWREH